jgi:hypothetical protein
VDLSLVAIDSAIGLNSPLEILEELAALGRTHFLALGGSLAATLPRLLGLLLNLLTQLVWTLRGHCAEVSAWVRRRMFPVTPLRGRPILSGLPSCG